MSPNGVRPRRRYAELGPLGRALLPAYVGCVEFPVVAALAAYVDDSIEDGAFVLAGYVGRVDMWDEQFTPAWKKALDAAPHKVKEFKTSDCRSMTGDFDKPWTRPQCNALTRSVVDVLTTCAPYNDFSGFGAAVFSAKPPEDMRRYVEEHAFSLCLYDILFDVFGHFSMAVDSPRDLQLILDDKPGFVERAQRAFRTVQQRFAPKFDEMPLPIFRSSEALLPLQAADLLAYESRKEARSRVEGKNRPVSKALERLVDSRFHKVRTFQWNQMVKAQQRQSGGLEFKHLLNGSILFESETPWRDIGHWPYAW